MKTKANMLSEGCVKLCKKEAAGCCIAGSLMLISFSQKMYRFHSAACPGTEILKIHYRFPLLITVPNTLFTVL